MRCGRCACWVDRHYHHAALTHWRLARPEQESFLAFKLVAQQPAMLIRLKASYARRLAEQAGNCAKAIAGERGDPTSNQLAAVARCVLTSIKAWRFNHLPFDGSVEQGTGTGATGNTFGLLWERAVSSCPQFTVEVARTCAALVAEAGSDYLTRLEEPIGSVLALATLRFAAWRQRGVHDAQDADPVKTDEACDAVQIWSESTGLDPLDVGYTGRRGEPWRQALSLALDSSALLAVSTRLASGPDCFGAQIWSAAEERHSYAVLAMKRSLPSDLTFETAQSVAAAAARHVEALHRGSARMPEFPEGVSVVPPRAVLAIAQRLNPEVVPSAA